MVREKFNVLKEVMDEQSRRIWAAVEAKALGRGGVSSVSRATGLSRTTIHDGIKSLTQSVGVLPKGKKRIRSLGGGRKPVIQHDPTVLAELERLLDPVTLGNSESPLSWTCKSVRQLAVALQNRGHTIGRQKVAQLLADMGYSLQANRKIKEGSHHPDRDAQFNYINEQVSIFQQRQQPVVSVDTKKKELVGDFKNIGRDWQPEVQPEPVAVHDFFDKQLGKVNPYGVYDQGANTGCVSVGTDNDTAEFAVESIRRWWQKMGFEGYPNATTLLLTADCGGSNGYRVRLWKVALQALANETGLSISVCHFPPCTSKWNKIEHRMFCHISMNWRGKPLTSHEVIVNLVGSTTTTTTGLTIKAELDTGAYSKGIKISDEELDNINLTKAAFHGEWNYIIAPNCSG
ncbi:MAG: ISAzo13 family transposase [Nitrospirae bacterium]|nr:ISAzo13 family transposase [Nitrospirota bacterium]